MCIFSYRMKTNIQLKCAHTIFMHICRNYAHLAISIQRFFYAIFQNAHKNRWMETQLMTRVLACFCALTISMYCIFRFQILIGRELNVFLNTSDQTSCWTSSWPLLWITWQMLKVWTRPRERKRRGTRGGKAGEHSSLIPWEAFHSDTKHKHLLTYSVFCVGVWAYTRETVTMEM